jgi:aminocarboxymuconate-semialdehyde decarboxylase
MTPSKKRGMKTTVIDIHAHLMGMWGPEIEEKYKKLMPYISRGPDGREVIMIKGKPRTSIPHPENLYKPMAILQEMDKQRVDIKTLSIMPLFNYDADPDLAIHYCRMQNEVLAETVKAHPDRFIGLATVPLQDPKEAANELQRAMRELSMKGVEIGDGVNGNNLDWPKLWPFYEKAQELGAFILCHPSSPPGVERMEKYGLWNLIGFPTATSLAIASLIFGGVLEDFPRLRFCFVHGGGFVPYQLGRLDHGFRVRADCREIIKKTPSEYFNLLYFDTITHYTPALEYLIETVGSDHVLLGTDDPFDVADPDPVATVSRLKSIPSEEKEKILGGNAIKLLGIGIS